jgi:hypothetical protein
MIMNFLRYSVFIAAMAAFAADTAAPPAAKVFDQQLTSAEKEIVGLAEAMPADKYDFAPTKGEFKGVRTFGLQVSHIATVLYEVSASVLSEKSPVDAGKNENGPASLKTKDEIVKYLKDAFAYGHKANGTLTSQNLMGMVTSAFGNEKVPRLSMATIAVWHSYDHYGQMVVYARLNGVVPPASR